MKPLFLSILSLCAIGCTGARHQHDATTIQEFNRNHPHARIIQHSPLPSGETVTLYVDQFPRISAAGAYTTEARTYVVTAKGEQVVSVAWDSK